MLVHGDAHSGMEVYPFIAEKLDLLFPAGVYDGFNNVLVRPIYLPAIDVAGGTTIDPNDNTTVVQQIAPGLDASVFVAAGTLIDQNGDPFDDVLSITEVPRERTPAALPTNLLPDVVVTIQPGEMSFLQPAPLALPNTAGYGPGARMNLWSINPTTGAFEIVGLGEVNAAATMIETIQGGVNNSSWHFFAFESADPDFGTDPHNLDQGCGCQGTDGETGEVTTSRGLLHSGAMVEYHTLPTYHSLGTDRAVSLTYDSARIAQDKSFFFRYPELGNGGGGGPSLTTGGQDVQVRVEGKMEIFQGNTGYYTRTFEDVLESIPAGNVQVTASIVGQPYGQEIFMPLSSLRTGNYTAKLTVGIYTYVGGERRAGAATESDWDFVHVNERFSAFGAGWGVNGLQHLVEFDEGVVLIDGDGTEVTFRSDGGSGFESPDGDFSTLVRLPDMRYQRTLPDQTVFEFDATGRLTGHTDRNGNITTFSYNPEGNLQSITDPVGLVTGFEYSGGLLSRITDPANRETLFTHDVQNNLRAIQDPDNTQRQFEYDGLHRMVAEVDKRGLRETTEYSPAGRVARSIRRDGSVINLLPAQSDRKPGLPTASVQDPIGNVTTYILDQAGQTIGIVDGEGPGPQFVRNENNQITKFLDPRGFETRREYDAFGNTTLIDDTQPSPPSGAINVVETGWQLTREIPFSDGSAAHVNPRDGQIYVAKRYGSNQGLYRVEADNSATLLTAGNNPAGVVMDPDDGDIFVSEDFGGRIFRTEFGGTGRSTWVNGFHPFDDDPFGMAIAPSNYGGNVINPGDALVADRGVNGVDEIWRFSPDTPEGEQVLHADNGTLINAADVAIGQQDIYVVDAGDEDGGGAGNGAIYRVLAGGQLAQIGTSTLLDDPMAVTIDPITADLLVLDGLAGKLLRIDPNSGTVSEMMTGFTIAGDNYAALDISPDGQQIVVTDRAESAIYVFTRQAATGATVLTYDPAFNQLTSVTDELGRMMLFDVDPSNGNMLSAISVFGLPDATSGETDDAISTFTYLPNGLVDTITDPRGIVTDVDYDALGRIQIVTEAVGSVDEATISYEYDAAGNIAAATDENGNRTAYVYDALNRVTQITEADPDGVGPLTSPVERMDYDPNGNLTSITNAQSNERTISYDNLDRPFLHTDEQSNIHRLAYFPNGMLRMAIDPEGNATTFTYDTRNRRLTSTDPDGD